VEFETQQQKKIPAERKEKQLIWQRELESKKKKQNPQREMGPTDQKKQRGGGAPSGKEGGRRLLVGPG